MKNRPADDSGYAIRDGVRLYWEVHGAGPVTIALVGVPQAANTMEAFRNLVPWLARHFRVVVWDVRGAGCSTPLHDPAAYAIAEAVADTIAVLDATATDRAVLVGGSRGCRTVIHTAAAHPERVVGAVLIAPAVVLPSVPVPSDLDPDFAAWVARSIAERPQWFDAPLAEQTAWRAQDVGPTLRRLYNEPYNLRALEFAISQIPEVELRAQHAAWVGQFVLPQGDDEPAVRSLRCPALVVNCTEDQIVRLDIGEAIARWTGATLVTLEGSGHAPIGRDPAKIVDLVRAFVERSCGVPVPSGRWRRAQARRRRALFLSSPIGLGHVRRDLAIAGELRRHHPDLEISWLAESPVVDVLQRAGETVHAASAHLLSQAEHVDRCAGEHDLEAFRTVRELDAIGVANFGVFADLTADEPFDLVVADEGFEVDHHLHENPERKRFAFAWLTDFVGWTPLPDDDEHEHALAADYNAQMIEQIARYRRIRDRAIFVGDYDDIPPDSFGPGLPDIPRWVAENFEAPGYISGFDPSAVPDPAETRRRLGWGADERVCVVAVGGSGVGRHLLARAAAASTHLRRAGVDRLVLVCGPRVDPAELRGGRGTDARGVDTRGVEVVGYVPDLPAWFAAADVAVVQGGLTTTMELVALRKPFVYVPLAHHFEQQRLVPWRLGRYGAGTRMDYDQATDPLQFAEAVTGALRRGTAQYRPVRTDGASRAAERLAGLL